jgi:UDP-N-acetylmuramate dehydrogenase
MSRQAKSHEHRKSGGGVNLDQVAQHLERLLPGQVRREVPFAELTTYRLGGPAAVLVRAGTAEDVATLAAALPAGVPVLVVGRGSNLVVADEGFAGVAVVLDGELADFRVEGTTVRAGGGLALPVLARRSAGAGLAGLEFFVGIPGSVGGAVRMNAGGHGRETAEVLRRAWLADLAGDGELEECGPGDLGLGYRRSLVRPFQVVVAAEFNAGSDDVAACEARIDEVVRWRRANQPGGSNAGSVFTNPPGDSAGRLIDACGLKGLTVGGVRVSERHANFFQAEPGALARDVVALVAEVARRVEEETGVRLTPELRRIGFAGEPGARPGAPPAWAGEHHAWSGGPESLGTPRPTNGAAA